MAYLAILLYDLQPRDVNGMPLDTQGQEKLLGNRFERLGQERRVKVLRMLRLVDDGAETAFQRVRSLRNKYLHLYSVDDATLRLDAGETYRTTVQLLSTTLGIQVTEGRVSLRPELTAYLTAKAVIQADPDDDAAMLGGRTE